MVTHEDICEIFAQITEEFSEPVAIGGRCESNIYYRVEDLDDKALNTCATYVADRLHSVISPQEPELFLKLPEDLRFRFEK